MNTLLAQDDKRGIKGKVKSEFKPKPEFFSITGQAQSSARVEGRMARGLALQTKKGPVFSTEPLLKQSKNQTIVLIP